MPLLVNTFFEERVQDLFSLAHRVELAFSAAGLEYRLIGGLATYLYVEDKEPDAGRLTRDIDIVVAVPTSLQSARRSSPLALNSGTWLAMTCWSRRKAPPRAAPST